MSNAMPDAPKLPCNNVTAMNSPAGRPLKNILFVRVNADNIGSVLGPGTGELGGGRI